MRISMDVEILEGLPILYIKSLSAIVCTDLHLGYEGVAAGKGVFLPKANLRNIKSLISRAANLKKPKRIIVDGDIKNEFSQVHVEEFNEAHEFVDFLRKELKFEVITLIKGNHDNFIDRLKEPFGIELHTQEALIGDYLFFHGEELPASNDGKMLVMGHVHPSIAIYNSFGVKEKLKCFLSGRLSDGRQILVLPALNYFAEGFSVNTEMGIDELAPIFKSMLDIDSMEALCVGEGETLNFGTVGELRNIEL
ncbi:MAG: metallophosphoesterase [Candidatus Micrarchaeaceae archaeon]